MQELKRKNRGKKGEPRAMGGEEYEGKRSTERGGEVTEERRDRDCEERRY